MNEEPPGITEQDEVNGFRRFPRSALVVDIGGYLGNCFLIGVLLLSLNFGTRWNLLGELMAAIHWTPVLLGLFFLLLAVVIGRHFRRTYKLDARGLHYRYGLLWRTHTVIPRNRVQFVDVSRGMLQQAFELATLRVHTAGVRSHRVSVHNLDEVEANALRDALIPAEL